MKSCYWLYHKLKDSVNTKWFWKTRGETQLPTFSKLIKRVLPSSMTHVDSSSLTSCGNSPSMMGGWPFTPHFKCFLAIVTWTSLGRAVKFTFSGTLNWNFATTKKKRLFRNLINCKCYYKSDQFKRLIDKKRVTFYKAVKFKDFVANKLHLFCIYNEK